MIKNFTPRLYQESILNTASLKNTLVVLPTGLGKTNIFLMLSALRLSQYPNSKILLIGPTKPLIDQYFLTFKKFFDFPEEKMSVFTGETAPEKRADLWKKSQIIFSTPQSIENDIMSNRIDISNVSLLGVDEAHRAVSGYSYVWVAKQYMQSARYPRILGLTASPGSDMEKITEVCKNLFIEEIEVRTEDDEDVKPYIQDTEMQWVEVELSEELKKIRIFLDRACKERIKRLKSWGVIKKPVNYVSKTDILAMQSELHKEAVQQKDNFTLWQSISLLAEIIKLQHSLELLETQGISALFEYLKKLKESALSTKIKAVKNLVEDPDFKAAFILTESLYNQKIIHPKMIKLKSIVEEEVCAGKKIIIFTQYRDSGSDIVNEICEIKGVKTELFVGQMKKGSTGLSQKEQKEMLDMFRDGAFNVLVATSIGEEGLDIPKVDTVIFYEPVPSAIRHIQRRGRTGRQDKGRVIVLIAKDTRDVGIRWSAFNKQKRMYSVLDKIKKKVDSPLRTIEKEQKLDDFMKKEVVIFFDHREKCSDVIKNLSSAGASLRSEQLKAGDFLCSQKIAVEFKTAKDFVDSIIDGRILEQMKMLKEHYERPVLIIQGMSELYNARNVHPRAIQGMIAAIAINYNIPVIRTNDSEETASLIFVMAKREQEGKNDYFTPHSQKKVTSIKEQQEYIISSFPNIGPVTAKEMLRKFKSIRNIVNADENELVKIENIAKTKAKRIREIIDSEYEE